VYREEMPQIGLLRFAESGDEALRALTEYRRGRGRGAGLLALGDERQTLACTVIDHEIDFGAHWDEGNQYHSLQLAYQSKIFLPRWNDYPSMIFWIGCASVADKLLTIVYSGIPDIPFDFSFFVLRARTLAMLISSLGA
jgi:hypothetical protein